MLKHRFLPLLFLCLCLLLTGCQKDGLKKEYSDHISDEQQKLILRYLETYQQALDAAKTAESIFEMGSYEQPLSDLYNEIDTSLSLDDPEPVQALKFDLMSLEYVFDEIYLYYEYINIAADLGVSRKSASLDILPSFVLDLGIMSEAAIQTSNLKELEEAAFSCVEAKLATYIETYCTR